jgi:DNA-directed RNA polymerase subunit RPC12/RpoP
MTITIARDTIVCPKCGSQRIVTHRQRRRSLSEGGILCSICRGIGTTRRFSDEDLRFWLRRYGTPCPRGVPVRQFIAAGGCPNELVELARDAFPE